MSLATSLLYVIIDLNESFSVPSSLSSCRILSTGKRSAILIFLLRAFLYNNFWRESVPSLFAVHFIIIIIIILENTYLRYNMMNLMSKVHNCIALHVFELSFRVHYPTSVFCVIKITKKKNSLKMLLLLLFYTYIHFINNLFIFTTIGIYTAGGCGPGFPRSSRPLATFCLTLL